MKKSKKNSLELKKNSISSLNSFMIKGGALPTTKQSTVAPDVPNISIGCDLSSDCVMV